MVWNTARWDQVGRHFRSGMARYRWRCCGFTAVAMLFAPCAAMGSMISPINGSAVPIGNLNSVFDSTTQAGNTYALETGTSFIPEGFDTRDLFGGSFGTFGWERHDVIFKDNQPIGTVESVDVTLAAPVAIADFNLYLEDDGTNGNRSASEFRLYAGGRLVDDIQILDTLGLQSYTSVYGSNFIQISDTLTGLPVTSDYTLEFIQNQQSGGVSGVRAMEFEASASLTSVPEPASISGLIFGGMALCARRRRSSITLGPNCQFICTNPWLLRKPIICCVRTAH